MQSGYCDTDVNGVQESLPFSVSAYSMPFGDYCSTLPTSSLGRW